MDKRNFRLLLKKYEQGIASSEEISVVEQWYAILGNDADLFQITEEELKTAKSEIWEKISASVVPGTIEASPPQGKLRKMVIRMAAAAAVIIFFAGIGFKLISFKETAPSKTVHENLLLKTNHSSTPQTFLLEDGSKITLQSGSSLSYPAAFAKDKREVYLQGEAFFNIAKEPGRQFLVHCNNITTQVLGTSFTIKPDENTGRISVFVKTGKVLVYEDANPASGIGAPAKNTGVIITPNQKTTYLPSSKTFATTLVDNPLPIKEEQEGEHVSSSISMLDFEDASLKEVTLALHTIYGIDIIPENENLYRCRFTGNLRDLSLYQALNILCTSLGHNYEVKGTKILITGKGCY